MELFFIDHGLVSGVTGLRVAPEVLHDHRLICSVMLLSVRALDFPLVQAYGFNLDYLLLGMKWLCRPEFVSLLALRGIQHEFFLLEAIDGIQEALLVAVVF